VKTFLVWAAILFALVLVIAAVVFRSQSARELLVLLRNAAWAYIALLAAVQIWRMNS
jgi:hypothetical protein